MSKYSQAEKQAHEALTLLGEARDNGDSESYKIAYDSFIRAQRMIDIESFDDNIIDSYGNVMKPSGKFGNSFSSKRAWDHKLPEDG